MNDIMYIIENLAINSGTFEIISDKEFVNICLDINIENKGNYKISNKIEKSRILDSAAPIQYIKTSINYWVSTLRQLYATKKSGRIASWDVEEGELDGYTVFYTTIDWVEDKIEELKAEQARLEAEGEKNEQST